VSRNLRLRSSTPVGRRQLQVTAPAPRRRWGRSFELSPFSPLEKSGRLAHKMACRNRCIDHVNNPRRRRRSGPAWLLQAAEPARTTRDASGCTFAAEQRTKGTPEKWSVQLLDCFPARRGLGSFGHRAASLQPGPPQAREAPHAASRADNNRHFTGGRPAMAASVGLFRHFGWPKPLAL